MKSGYLDITYVYTKECGWCYLATILDLHSKRLIGWKFDKRMTSELVQAALKMLFRREN